MARETKVGLLIGLGVILLVGIIISDHLGSARLQSAEAGMTDFAPQAQDGIHPTPPPPAQAVADEPGDEASDRDALKPTPRSTPQLIDSHRFSEPRLAPPDQRQPETQSADAVKLADLPAPPTAWRSIAPLPDDPSTNAGRLADDALSNAGGTPLPTPSLDPADLPATAPLEATADATAAPVPAPHRRAGAELIHYVEADDSLAELANRYYGDSAYQGSIAAVNRGALAPDGTLIAGTRLIIPNRAGHVELQADANNARVGLLDTGMFEAVPGINARGEAPSTVLPVTAAAQRETSRPATVEVMPGDSLSKLAERHLGSSARYLELYEANQDQLSSPDVVVVGMQLKLPPTASATAQAAAEQRNAEATVQTEQPAPPARAAVKTYTVEAGDNLSKIAEKALGDRNRWRELYDANRDRLDSPDKVVVGQELRLPS